MDCDCLIFKVNHSTDMVLLSLVFFFTFLSTSLPAHIGQFPERFPSQPSTVQTCGARFPLSSWYCSAIPCWPAAAGGGLGVTQKAAILGLGQTGHPEGATDHRAFCVAGPRVWNSLSSSTQSAPSLLVFRRLLKCELLHRCYDLC